MANTDQGEVRVQAPVRLLPSASVRAELPERLHLLDRVLGGQSSAAGENHPRSQRTHGSHFSNGKRCQELAQSQLRQGDRSMVGNH